MSDLPPVISQAEYGRRGMAALVAKYGERQVNAWRRKGGRPKDPTLIEILEQEREQASARRGRRVSSKGRGPIAEFDRIT